MVKNYPGPTKHLVGPIKWDSSPEPEVKKELIVGPDLSKTFRVADGQDYQMIQNPVYPEFGQNKKLRKACAGEE